MTQLSHAPQPTHINIIYYVDEQKQSVKKVQIRACMMAEMLHSESDVAKILKESDDGANEFLNLSSSRVKSIAEGNVKRMYEIEYFMDAVKEVRNEVEQKQHAAAASAGGGEGGGAATTNNAADEPNYERSMQDALERARERGENDPNREPTDEHELMIEMREKLGEKIQKKRSRKSGGGDDSDDDLEVVRNNVDDENALKCPITGMLFVNPVKNKVCHHVYDRAGLSQMLNARKHTCPVPGCANKNVSMTQVENDEEMVLKVRRHQKRLKADKKKRDMEDEEDDDDVLE
jgi:hypothetical protein